MEKKTIVLTGGHALATAHALITYLRKKSGDLRIVWIGPTSHIEGKMVESLENNLFEEVGVKVYKINAGRLQTKFTKWTIPAILKIPMGMLQAFFVLLQEKPRVVLSFGGFAGFPVVVSAWILRIPVIIHEQTIAAGRANILSAKLARKVAISRPESKKYFPHKKTLLVGNPVDPNILAVKIKLHLPDVPTLLITGGHTGSQTINELIKQAAKKILKDFTLIHQTGKLDFGAFKKFKKTLPSNLRKRYFVYPVISASLWPSYLERADIIISRAGANIVSQILVTKRPSILIPLPNTFLNEQIKNARFAESFGIARILYEEQLNEENFLREVYYLKSNWDKIKARVKNKISPDINASKQLTDLISEYIK